MTVAAGTRRARTASLGNWGAQSTVHAVLRRHGRPRLCDLDRPTGKPGGYGRDRPGELASALPIARLSMAPRIDTYSGCGSVGYMQY